MYELLFQNQRAGRHYLLGLPVFNDDNVVHVRNGLHCVEGS